MGSLLHTARIFTFEPNTGVIEAMAAQAGP